MSGGGDSTAQAAEQQQAAFNQQLMGIFSSQYANQSGILNFLKGTLEPQIAAGGKGYTDAQMTAMRTGATDTIAQQYQNAQMALNNNLNQRNGGSALPSGTSAQIEGGLLQSEAQTQAGAQNQITQANANLQQQNYWASINALNGVAAQVNPLGYANSATSGSGAVSNLSQAVTQANGPTWGSILGGIAGAGLGAIGSYYGSQNR